MVWACVVAALGMAGESCCGMMHYLCAEPWDCVVNLAPLNRNTCLEWHKEVMSLPQPSHFLREMDNQRYLN